MLINAGYIVEDADIKQVITDFLNEIANDLKAYLAYNNRNATHKSSDSITPANISADGGQVVGAGWIEETFKGRGPGPIPPISSIIDWLNARGLPRSMAWPVAISISKHGTKLYRNNGAYVNGLTEVMTPERIKDFADSVSDLYESAISSTISDIFADLNRVAGFSQPF